jgi:peptidoglycan hydrolase-like protein with peptidoglycan-binding domain
MAQAERLAIQSDLAWVGQYNGAITGEVSERMVAAIKEFQKSRGGKQTGVLNPQERGILTDTAKRRQENVGWKIVTDAGTGARLGVPTKLVPQQSSDAAGAKWTSPTGTVQIQLSRRKEANPTTAKLAEQEKKEPAGRKIDYTVVKPDFFVLSGLQGLKKFYVRGTFKGDEVRILTILYDQATENTVEPVVIAMSSAFNPFPAGAPIAGPPPRKTVEYGTGIVVSGDGAIIADRQVTDSCLTIAIAGHGNADRVAEDKDLDLVLLRIYGARGLKPLSLANGVLRSGVDLTGIADPQNQGGGAVASSVKVSISQVGSASNLALTPTPALGFSGAAAFDAEGKFAGVALLKPVLVAGAMNPTPAAQAALVPADAVRDFLKANGVNASGDSSDAKAAVVRVICVRK